jgi:hypothetical protein
VENEAEVVGAATGLRTGADGEETGLVGTETGEATGASTVVGADTGASTVVGADTGASTGLSVATNVHVLGQSIKTKHSQGNGYVTVASPGEYPYVSSRMVVSQVPQLAVSRTVGSHGMGVLNKSATGHVTFPIPVKFIKPVTGGSVGRLSLKYSHDSAQPSARIQSQSNGKYPI